MKTGKEATHRNAYLQQMDKAIQLRGQQETDKFRIEKLNAAIDSMKVKRAAGQDDIQISFFKQLSANAKDELLCLYNQSYAKGAIPGAWRRVEMIAIEKPGRTPGYRPISLTNVSACCMERLILTRFSPWTESILPLEQAGFRRHSSCEVQIAAITEYIAQAMYSKTFGIALLLDYSGAYDRVSIEGLLAMLGLHHCPPQLFLCLRGFLQDRRAYCIWGESRSRTRILPIGLPHGSSLSCLLWDTSSTSQTNSQLEKFPCLPTTHQHG